MTPLLAAYIAGGSAIFLVVFFYLYILVMGIYRAYLAEKFKDRPFVFALCVPAIVAGLVVDVFANITYATIAFKELPQEWLVTDRLSRIKYDPKESKENKELATWICSSLLDLFDPSGDHCKKPVK